jgi:hypothetical protein
VNGGLVTGGLAVGGGLVNGGLVTGGLAVGGGLANGGLVTGGLAVGGGLVAAPAVGGENGGLDRGGGARLTVSRGGLASRSWTSVTIRSASGAPSFRALSNASRAFSRSPRSNAS